MNAFKKLAAMTLDPDRNRKLQGKRPVDEDSPRLRKQEPTVQKVEPSSSKAPDPKWSNLLRMETRINQNENLFDNELTPPKEKEEASKKRNVVGSKSPTGSAQRGSASKSPDRVSARGKTKRSAKKANLMGEEELGSISNLEDRQVLYKYFETLKSAIMQYDAPRYRKLWQNQTGLTNRQQKAMALRQLPVILKFANESKAHAITDFILQQDGLELNQRDAAGVDCFWYACYMRNAHAVQKMLQFEEYGQCAVDITCEDEDSGNALHCCVERLFATGATEILQRLSIGKFSDFQKAVPGAFSAPPPLQMVEYLNRVRSDGLTALGIAIEQSSLLMTTVLCEAGADINRYDAKTKQSPVSLCLKLNSPDIVNYLLSQPSLDISFKNSLGKFSGQSDQFNALFYCIENIDLARVKIIVETAVDHQGRRAFIEIQNSRGEDPLFHCLLQIERLLRTFRTEQDYFTMDYKVETKVNALVAIFLHLYEHDSSSRTVEANRHILEPVYNREIRPGVTLLWKCVQLDLVPLIERLLRPGIRGQAPLVKINHKTAGDGTTVLMKLLREDLEKLNCAGLLSESIRENIVDILMQYSPDLSLKDGTGRNALNHSADASVAQGIDDYLIKYRHQLVEKEKREAAEQEEWERKQARRSPPPEERSPALRKPQSSIIQPNMPLVVKEQRFNINYIQALPHVIVSLESSEDVYESEEQHQAASVSSDDQKELGSVQRTIESVKERSVPRRKRVRSELGKARQQQLVILDVEDVSNTDQEQEKGKQTISACQDQEIKPKSKKKEQSTRSRRGEQVPEKKNGVREPDPIRIEPNSSQARPRQRQKTPEKRVPSARRAKEARISKPPTVVKASPKASDRSPSKLRAQEQPTGAPHSRKKANDRPPTKQVILAERMNRNSLDFEHSPDGSFQQYSEQNQQIYTQSQQSLPSLGKLKVSKHFKTKDTFETNPSSELDDDGNRFTNSQLKGAYPAERNFHATQPKIEGHHKLVRLSVEDVDSDEEREQKTQNKARKRQKKPKARLNHIQEEANDEDTSKNYESTNQKRRQGDSGSRARLHEAEEEGGGDSEPALLLQGELEALEEARDRRPVREPRLLSARDRLSHQSSVVSRVLKRMESQESQEKASARPSPRNQPSWQGSVEAAEVVFNRERGRPEEGAPVKRSGKNFDDVRPDYLEPALGRIRAERAAARAISGAIESIKPSLDEYTRRPANKQTLIKRLEELPKEYDPVPNINLLGDEITLNQVRDNFSTSRLMRTVLDKGLQETSKTSVHQQKSQRELNRALNLGSYKLKHETTYYDDRSLGYHNDTEQLQHSLNEHRGGFKHENDLKDALTGERIRRIERKMGVARDFAPFQKALLKSKMSIALISGDYQSLVNGMLEGAGGDVDISQFPDTLAALRANKYMTLQDNVGGGAQEQAHAKSAMDLVNRAQILKMKEMFHAQSFKPYQRGGYPGHDVVQVIRQQVSPRAGPLAGFPAPAQPQEVRRKEFQEEPEVHVRLAQKDVLRREYNREKYGTDQPKQKRQTQRNQIQSQDEPNQLKITQNQSNHHYGSTRSKTQSRTVPQPKKYFMKDENDSRRISRQGRRDEDGSEKRRKPRPEKTIVSGLPKIIERGALSRKLDHGQRLIDGLTKELDNQPSRVHYEIKKPKVRRPQYIMKQHVTESYQPSAEDSDERYGPVEQAKLAAFQNAPGPSGVYNLSFHLPSLVNIVDKQSKSYANLEKDKNHLSVEHYGTQSSGKANY